MSADLRYSADHLWLRRDGEQITVGITEWAARSLTLVNAVDLPAPGATLRVGAELAAIDAQKTLLEFAAPLPLRITAVNERLLREPLLVRLDPQSEGWLLEAVLDRSGDWATLLDEAAYQALVESEREAVEGRPHPPERPA